MKIRGERKKRQIRAREEKRKFLEGFHRMEWEVTECRDMSEGRVTEYTWRNGEMMKDLMEGSERNSKKRKRNKMGK